LLENSTATVFGLTVLILWFGPVSGAHFNPVVSLADWVLGRRNGKGLALTEVAAYALAQVAGGIAGALLANAMFDVGTSLSTTHRASGGHLLGEVVATAGLVALIFALVRSGRGALAAPAVGAYIGAAYWFTSSTSFANPAVTIGRMFSDTFAGIAPASVPAFVLAQVGTPGRARTRCRPRSHHPTRSRPDGPLKPRRLRRRRHPGTPSVRVGARVVVRWSRPAWRQAVRRDRQSAPPVDHERMDGRDGHLCLRRCPCFPAR
jgi:hypothetical protein